MAVIGHLLNYIQCIPFKPLTLLINQTISEGIFPNEVKLI